MLKKIVTVAVNALCVAAILLSLTAAAVLLTTPKGQAPSVFGYSFLTVLTGSMEPALPEGSLIVVRETDPAQLQVGDVVSYYTSIAGHSGLLNTHRITAVETDSAGALTFRTRGDANPGDDPTPVQPQQLLGKVVSVSGGVGGLIAALRKPYVFLPVVIIPLLLLIVSSIRRILRLAKDEIQQAAHELEDQTHDQDR